ncbi:hypothetical protein LG634_35330 [Streptomyces bambusae]|uniref:hypothetical protein n=1 Tax=Streptomyces bambusae TaxID=1550616 RepID=UPI001CFFF42F|nr:hypothetical protein [Streptomyces bambusae]MCB5170064.1 hypothetical protein [Streptomyces bambusae]
MPIAIAVTSADLVLPAADRHTPDAVALSSPQTAGLEESLAEMSGLLERHGYVVAVLPSFLPVAFAQRLHTVRAILESDRIALLDIDLPPLGTALLVRQLRQLSVCDFSPGVIASAARLLSHYVYAGALLGSVARLDRVPVSLKSHAKSWLPGSQFAVLANPRPHLARLGSGPKTGPKTGPKDGPGGHGGGKGRAGSRGKAHAKDAGGPELPPGPDFGTHLTFARGQLASDWVAAELAPAWQVGGVLEAPLPSDSARWWATSRLVEFAAAIPDISVLYQLVASVRREPCRWCGLELIGDRCGFCAAPLAAPLSAQSTQSAQSPLSTNP